MRGIHPKVSYLNYDSILNEDYIGKIRVIKSPRETGVIKVNRCKNTMDTKEMSEIMENCELEEEDKVSVNESKKFKSNKAGTGTLRIVTLFHHFDNETNQQSEFPVTNEKKVNRIFVNLWLNGKIRTNKV